MNHHSNHYYGDVSNLNAPYDAIAVQGWGMGQVPPTDPHPWRRKTQATMDLQANVNSRLASLTPPFCPILVDGELGPRTCGALAQLELFHDDVPQVPACANPPEPIITPQEPPCPSGPGPAPAPTPGPTDPEDLVKKGGVSPMLIGVGVAALAIAGVLAYRASQKKR